MAPEGRAGEGSASGGPAHVLSLERVTVRLAGVPVLEEVSLTVPRGVFLGIVGPNGGGKTTLLRVALGLLRPERGRVLLFGRDVWLGRGLERVGYVPQRAGLDRRFPTSVEELVLTAFPGRRSWGRIGAAEKAAAARAMREVGVWEDRRRAVGRLSGGQQQRAFLARALAGEPELLLLDEPTTGVDPGGREAFFGLLRELQRRRSLTVVMVTHDVGAVAREVTAVACLNRRLVYHGPPAGLGEAGLAERVYGMPVHLVRHDH